MRVSACFASVAVASSATQGANPIRRVVNLLQEMQAKIEAEGEKQDKMFSKFQCYCETNTAKLADAITDSKSKIESLTTDIESSTEDRKQTIADLAEAKDNRETANKAIDDATRQRNKDNAAFEETSSEFKTNIAALDKAIPAIENNMGSFLQTDTSALVNVVNSIKDVSFEDRSSVQSFLQSKGSSTYAPQSGEIIGIMKQMQDTMKADLKEATTKETEAVADFNELVAAQNKAIQAATDTIEEKTEQSGQLAVAIVELKNEKSDVEDQLKADTGYSEQLAHDCEQQTKDYANVKQTRADEMLAIADTIKILNDDDVLDLFKKTMPSPSLLQVESSRRQMAEQAIKLIRAAGSHPRLDLIALALKGKSTNFDAVTKMVDSMEGTLKKEQEDDEAKMEYCKKEFHDSEMRVKELGHEKDHLDQEHSNLDAAIKELKEKIASLEDGIKDLDKAVAEATENRKEEHDDYVSSTAQDQAAVQIMEFAKNRLAKFYQPKVYKEGPKRVLTDEERLYASGGGDIGTTPPPGELANTGISVGGFVQIKQHTQDAPPEAPKVGGYEQQKGGGVMGLIEHMINDLKTEMNQHRLEEEDAQEDYEKLMKDSAEKRAADSRAISEHEAALAESRSDLSANSDNRKANAKNTGETHGYNQDMQKACNFLLENFEARKTARVEEKESLDKSKVVLSGADVAFMQTTRAGGKFMA